MHGSDERRGEQGHGSRDGHGRAGLAAAGAPKSRARKTRVPEGNVGQEVGQARRGGGPHEPHHRAVDQAQAIEVVHRG